MVEENLNALLDNLHQKAQALEQLGGSVKQMTLLLRSEDTTLEQLDVCMDEQDALTGRINVLSDDFERLWEGLKNSLPDKGAAHQQQMEQIRKSNALVEDMMQEMIGGLSENRKMLEEFLARERKNLGTGRKTSKAALNYYKSMSGSNVVPSYFLDHKQ